MEKKPLSNDSKLNNYFRLIEEENLHLKRTIKWSNRCAYLFFFIILFLYIASYLVPHDNSVSSNNKFYRMTTVAFILADFSLVFFSIKSAFKYNKESLKEGLFWWIVITLIPMIGIGLGILYYSM